MRNDSKRCDRQLTTCKGRIHERHAPIVAQVMTTMVLHLPESKRGAPLGAPLLGSGNSVYSFVVIVTLWILPLKWKGTA
jgi:uncharacterized membrane protein